MSLVEPVEFLVEMAIRVGHASSRLSAEPAGMYVLGAFVPRRREEHGLASASYLHQLPEKHEGRVWSETRAACCMLCVTMTIVIEPLQFVKRLLDLGRRQGSSAVVGSSMQQDLRLERDGAGDAQPLLLAAGQAERAVLAAGP